MDVMIRAMHEAACAATLADLVARRRTKGPCKGRGAFQNEVEPWIPADSQAGS